MHKNATDERIKEYSTALQQGVYGGGVLLLKNDDSEDRYGYPIMIILDFMLIHLAGFGIVIFRNQCLHSGISQEAYIPVLNEVITEVSTQLAKRAFEEDELVRDYTARLAREIIEQIGEYGESPDPLAEYEQSLRRYLEAKGADHSDGAIKTCMMVFEEVPNAADARPLLEVMKR